jgi:hypothetical protein
MNQIEKNTVEKINSLHGDIYSLLKNSIDKAIEIGELLITKKSELPHGEFGQWIKDNLIFTDRTARNYMRVFENKDKALGAGNLSEAYKMLEAPKTETFSDLPYIGKYSDFDHKLALQDDSYMERYFGFDLKLALQDVDEGLKLCKTKIEGIALIERVDKFAQNMQNEWGRYRIHIENSLKNK